MNKITKEEVSQWIRNLIPYLGSPMILAPKGCIKENVLPQVGKIIEYDSSLIPNTPKVLSQEENLKMLVELYKAVQDDE